MLKIDFWVGLGLTIIWLLRYIGFPILEFAGALIFFLAFIAIRMIFRLMKE